MEKNLKNNDIDFTFSKDERLCNKKLFDILFAKGTSFLSHPLKIIFAETGHASNYPVQVAFAVSRKLFSKAVIRNLIKRRMREAYRLNKHNFYSLIGDKKLVLIIIYVEKEIMEYRRIENSMKRALNLLAKKVS
jgi:ribonuclease P protein component